jgi:RNA polymerase sigma-70 factor (family 1)
LSTELQHSNKDLFVQVAAGDEQAFRQVFHYYTPKLQPFVINIVKSASVAEEIVQEVFLKLWINRQQVGDKDSPSSWLFTVAAHQSFSFLKKVATERRFIDRVKQQMQYPVNENPTEDKLFTRENDAMLKEAIEALPTQRQAIYRLSREENLSHRQIAAQLRISPNTVKNQMVSAVRSIREYIRKAGALLLILVFIILGFFFS